MRRHRRAIVAIAATLLTFALGGATLAGAVAPVVSIDPAEKVGFSTAEAKGTVDPGGLETSYHFEYATQAQFEASEWAEASWGGFGGFSQEEAEGASGPVPVGPATLEGLIAGTTYHLRLVAQNADGTEAAVAPTFATQEATAPALTLDAATGVSATAAHISGSVDPEGGNTNPLGGPVPISWELQFTRAAQPESWQYAAGGTIEGAEAVSSSPIEVEADLQLEPNTEYLFRLQATYAGKVKTAAPGEFTTDAVGPEVADNPVFDPTQTTATLAARLNPHNSPVTECKFVYGIGAASGNEAPCKRVSAIVGVKVSATAGQFRLSFEGKQTADIAFDASASTVQAALEAMPTIGAGNVSVSGGPGDKSGSSPYRISFQGSLAFRPIYLFAEDGTQPLVNGVKAGSAESFFIQEGFAWPSGNGFGQAEAEVSGLAPGTDYRFKLVATSAVGTEEGEEQSFSTFPEAGPEPTCPNQAILDAQHTDAPDCRGYEMVSPLDKNGGAVVGESTLMAAAADGEAAAFSSRAGFADSVGSGAVGFTQYVSHRGSDGWTSHGITPTPQPNAVMTLAFATLALGFADDLSRALVTGYQLRAAGDDLPVANIYSQDTTTQELRTIVRSEHEPLGLGDFIFPPASFGFSSDAKQVAFAAQTRLLEAAPEGVVNAYEWDDGTLRLAGILPDGNAPSKGSTLPERYSRVVSTDGSRVLFLSPAENTEDNAQLYLRRNHSSTAKVSEAETSLPGEEPRGVQLQWASPNGKHVIFVTSSALLDEDENAGPDLYLYTDGPQPSAESNLQMITRSGDVTRTKPSEGQGVIGASDDASRIYYSVNENIFLWNEGATHPIGRLEASVEIDELPSAISDGPGAARVSTDGQYLAFLGARTVLKEETQKVVRTLYLYDAERDSISCLSCRDYAGNVSDGEVTILPKASNSSPTTSMNLRPRFLSPDGKRVFFSSPASLVPEDTNGVADVYRYDTDSGEVAIVSPGNTPNGVWFADASASGNDVFMVTADRLVGADSDRLIDMYDARVGGGFPEPPPEPAPCVGDGCRGPASGAPRLASPGTPNFVGAPNPKCRRVAQRGQKRKSGQRARGCAKKAQHKKRRHPKKHATHQGQRGGR